MRYAVLSFVVVAIAALPGRVYGLGADHPADRPFVANHLPKEMVELINTPQRVHGFFVNETDVFFFAGNTEKLNKFLQDFSKVPGVQDRAVTLHAGRPNVASPWDKEPRNIAGDWKLVTLGAASAGVDIWIGGDVALRQLVVPLTLQVELDPALAGNEELEGFLRRHRALQANILPPPAPANPPRGRPSPPPADLPPAFRGMEFLQDIPALRRVNLRMTEVEFLRLVAAHKNDIFKLQMEERGEGKSSFTVCMTAGHCVIVMFRDNVCSGVQRRPDWQWATEAERAEIQARQKERNDAPTESIGEVEVRKAIRRATGEAGAQADDVAAAGPERDAKHIDWIAKSLREMQTIKPGMTRADLLKVFREEGGLSNAAQRRYAYRDCPYIKVDVKFDAEKAADGRVGRERPEDKITSVSQPFLEWTIAD